MNKKNNNKLIVNLIKKLKYAKNRILINCKYC